MDILTPNVVSRHLTRTAGQPLPSNPEPGDLIAFNTALAKLLLRLKRDTGATTVAQNYRGTGSRAYRRQVFVRFPNKVTDLWLENDRIELGGVTTVLGKLPYGDKSPEQVYAELVPVLKAWATA